TGESVDQFPFLGGTLLFYAAKEGRLDVARWAIEQGANPNGVYHETGGVPLEVAIRKENIPMIKLLVESGADPDLEMSDRVTPRRRAQELGNEAVISALPPE